MTYINIEDRREASRRHYRKHRKQYFARNKLKRQRISLWLTVQKMRPCFDCKQTFPAFVMDFDHRDRSTKTEIISRLVHRMSSWKCIEAEIAKCDLVCANCHRVRTFGSQERAKTPAKAV